MNTKPPSDIDETAARDGDAGIRRDKVERAARRIREGWYDRPEVLEEIARLMMTRDVWREPTRRFRWIP